jgi:ribonucleoside-triphosphate reductase
VKPAVDTYRFSDSLGNAHEFKNKETMTQLPTLYQQYIHQSKYARWDDDKGRRETWEETVDRYIDQIARQADKLGGGFGQSEIEELRSAILNQEVLPSMRALMTAGPALERDNVAAYNCAYVAIDDVRVFAEILYILCCGTGVGYSVERQCIAKLPVIAEQFYKTDTTIVVGDSKIGWATAFDELFRLLYAGKIPNIDYSQIRPAGSPLKTFGGRASGPGPLKDLFEHTIRAFQHAAGRKLNSVEVHGIICKIGDVIVSGGVRRSALISLFNPSDERMMEVKSGQWWEHSPHYRLANNSAVFTEKPEVERFMERWLTLLKNKSGEPGFISREALQFQAGRFGRRDPNHEFGVNPCAEIILRSMQFCNLSTVVLRPTDTEEDIRRKVRLAAILGTIQASFTDFRFLRKEWKQNCEEEALLGVSFMGIMDNDLMNGIRSDLEPRLESFRDEVQDTNVVYAERWGLNPSAASTCVKPDGNGSGFANANPGIHGAYFKKGVRRTRESKLSPVAQLAYMQGVLAEDDMHNPADWVFSWPSESKGRTRHDYTALEHLELWRTYAEHWCEHKPSITVSIKEREWFEVGGWCLDNWKWMSGVAFLPWDGGQYQQAPYEALSDEEHAKLLEESPETIDWSLLGELEKEDQTDTGKELACYAGACELPAVVLAA